MSLAQQPKDLVPLVILLMIIHSIPEIGGKAMSDRLNASADAHAALAMMLKMDCTRTITFQALRGRRF